jgi:LysM repeat protein
MRKKIVAMLIAFIMVCAVNIQLAAVNDPVNPESQTPAPRWEVTEFYHWVVRGEDLDSIAALYGVPVDYIRAINGSYFADLDLRNKTHGENRQLEHGIRLRVLFTVTLRFYVVRGMTVENILDGSFRHVQNGVEYWRLEHSSGFRLRATQQELYSQNPLWFTELGQLSTTMGLNLPLWESYGITEISQAPIFNSILSANIPMTAGTVWEGASKWGSPIRLTIPVHVEFTGNPVTHRFNLSQVTYMANNRETMAVVPNMSATPVAVTTPPTTQTAPYEPFPSAANNPHPILGVTVGNWYGYLADNVVMTLNDIRRPGGATLGGWINDNNRAEFRGPAPIRPTQPLPTPPSNNPLQPPLTAIASAPAPAPAAPPPPAAPAAQYVTVGAGGTNNNFWQISVNNGVSIDEIQRLNPGVVTTNLRAGQQIRIR